MKRTQSSSVILVKCMAAASITVILSAGIAAADLRFNPHGAKGGLPVCMDTLDSITANLETCETKLVEAQDENSYLEQLLVDLEMYEENEASSSLVIGVPKTGQISSSQPGDDGDLQKGTAWPDPRFTDNGDGTVTDNMTGLVWTKNANMFVETQTWYAAVGACNALANGGFDLVDGSITGDWRLPNVKELQSLIDYGQYNPVLPAGHPFDVQFLDTQSSYWTSTSYAVWNIYSWVVSLSDGNTYHDLYIFGKKRSVWCVRDGQ